MIDKLVNHLAAARQVPRDDGQWRWRRPGGHLHRHRRSDRMRATRGAADSARDVNGVGRLSVSQDRLAGARLPGKFPALDMRVERPPIGEIDLGAQRETPADPRHRLDLESSDSQIAGEFLQHSLAVERPSTSAVRSVVKRRLRLPVTQRGATIRIKINRKIFENHYDLGAPRRLTKTLSPDRNKAKVACECQPMYMVRHLSQPAQELSMINASSQVWK